MDELIINILRELNVDECFIENARAYRVLKFYVRTRLTDIYKYQVYLNKKEKIICSQEEIRSQIEKENFNWDTVRDFISVDDVKMLKYINSIKNNKEKWSSIIEQLKTNNPILSVDCDINVKQKHLIVSYCADNIKEKSYLYYDRVTDCVDILYVHEENKTEKKVKKAKKKEDSDLEFSEYEKIRLNIHTNDEIESRQVVKKEDDLAISQEIENPLLQKRQQRANGENDDRNKTYFIMYEKVDKNGCINCMNMKNYSGYLDIKQINKIVNKLETKYNNSLFEKVSKVTDKGESFVKGIFSKGKNKDDDGER